MHPPCCKHKETGNIRRHVQQKKYQGHVKQQMKRKPRPYTEFRSWRRIELSACAEKAIGMVGWVAMCKIGESELRHQTSPRCMPKTRQNTYQMCVVVSFSVYYCCSRAHTNTCTYLMDRMGAPAVISACTRTPAVVPTRTDVGVAKARQLGRALG
jgi:hypothetical protein